MEAAKAEYEKLLNARSGGVYIPPAKLRALQAQITDRSSREYQRMAWEALKKSINGLVNKANVGNMKHIVPELFSENLVRGRGLLTQSLIKAQAAALPFTPIYAALIAIVNTKLPNCGELLLRRLVLRFRKGFKRNDKAVCLSSSTFIAHLTNVQVANPMIVAQILLLLLKKPTDDSVEIAVNITREVGEFLETMNAAISNVIFDQFRTILHDSDLDKRTQYMVEVLFQVRKDKFKDNPAVKEELDLVEEEDQVIHWVDIDDQEIDGQDTLNVFRFDENFEANEESYKSLKAEILGEGSDDEDGSDDDASSEEEEDQEQKALEIKDQTNADLVNLRRTIYLTIQSSLDAEEAVHKLLRVQLPVGQEHELPSMVVECCSQEKSFTKFFGVLAERLAKINRLWTDLFSESFLKYYETIHRYDNNKLRNIAQLFAHLFATDAIGWHVMSVIHLNEEETTSSSRIFIKILFQGIAEAIGMPKLQARMKDESLQESFRGLFPRDNARNVRFSINYFTSIGMGAITEDMREFLQNMPKPALPAPVAAEDSDSDSVSSYSSYTGSSYSSRSRSRPVTPRRALERRGRSISRSPPRRNGKDRSYSRGRRSTRSISTGRSRSRSIPRSPPRRGAARGRSTSRTPPRRYRDRSYSSRSRASTRSVSPRRSRSPPPPRRRAASPLRSPRNRSRSKSPPRRGAPRRRNSSSHSRSRSREPPRRRGGGRARSVSSSPRSRSPKRSPSPPPQRRRRRNSSSSLSSAPRKKYRRSS